VSKRSLIAYTSGAGSSREAVGAAAETLLTIAADPRYLGASIGFLAVLHTWGQKLHYAGREHTDPPRLTSPTPRALQEILSGELPVALAIVLWRRCNRGRNTEEFSAAGQVFSEGADDG